MSESPSKHQDGPLFNGSWSPVSTSGLIDLTIPLDAEGVAACLGPPAKIAAHPTLAVAVRKATEAAIRSIRARAVYLVAPTSQAPHPTGGPNGEAWSKIPWTAMFAATIGPNVEQAALAAADAGRLVEAMALDAAGSAASLALTDGVVHHLITDAALAAAGLAPTLLAFPGDEGFPFEEQLTIVHALPPAALADIGLTCLPSGALLPEKSVAGVIGLTAAGRPDPVQAQNLGKHNCSQCPVRARCTFRR